MLFDDAPVIVTFTGHRVYARYNTEQNSLPTYTIAVECMMLTDHYALTNVIRNDNTTAIVPDHFMSGITMDSAHKAFVHVFDATHRIRPQASSSPLSFLTLASGDLVYIETTVNRDAASTIHFTLAAIHVLQCAATKPDTGGAPAALTPKCISEAPKFAYLRPKSGVKWAEHIGELPGSSSETQMQALKDFVAFAYDLQFRHMGGTEAWDRLTAEEQIVVDAAIWKAVVQHVGEATYNALPKDERVVAEFFIHGGHQYQFDEFI
ncbi:hypothetical protein LXA43DRAFT_1119306 [Ganoderma leucocontextum]|nr:hypothetical protein LXA43DRAFT_1119306 [Ganoderma leucocontextum]